MKKPMPFGFLKGLVRLLWVDDDAEVLATAQEVFESRTVFAVDTASSLKDAIRKADAKSYHVCLADLGMPHNGGSEYHMIEHYSSKFPVIVVSGHRSIREGAECAKRGAFAVLEKPGAFADTAMQEPVRAAVLNSLLGMPATDRQRQLRDITLSFISNHSPRKVEDWALELGIGERHLRKISVKYGLSAKALATALTIVDMAICCHWDGPPKCGAVGKLKCLHADACKQLHSYYYTHMSAMKRFLENNRPAP